MPDSNLLKKILILIIVFHSCELSAQVSAFPSNGKIRIRRANALWEETLDKSTICPGDSVKTKQFSECLVKLNSHSYLIALPNTLLTFSSPSNDINSKDICEDFESPHEFNLVEGGVIVRLSQKRNNSYFTLNTGRVFGGVKGSRQKTSVLFRVESNNKRDLWSIYEGKINLIARDPEAGSLSISNSEFINISEKSLLKRSKIIKVQSSSPLSKLLKDQFNILSNAEKIEHSLLQNPSTQEVNPFTQMNLSLLSKGREIHQAITREALKNPSRESSTALNLSMAIDRCLAHSAEGSATIKQPSSSRVKAYRSLSTANKKEDGGLKQLRLILRRITEIRNEVSLNYKLQQNEQPTELNSGKTIAELRLIKRQIGELNKPSPPEAVQRMSNSLLRTIKAIENRLDYQK